MGAKKVRKQNILIRYMKGPIWVLARARDLYLKTLTGLGGPVSYGNAMGCPTPHIPSIPRSLSVSSSNASFKTADEEFRDLLRLASTRRFDGAELHRSKSAVPFGGGGGGAAAGLGRRSNTVAGGFGRIDENKSFEFGEEDDVVLLRRGVVCPRTNSYGVARRFQLA